MKRSAGGTTVATDIIHTVGGPSLLVRYRNG
jgi:hypothetical protein